MNKVMILGADGYIGWSLALKLLKEGHEVFCIDNFMRRYRAPESLTPLRNPYERFNYLRQWKGFKGLEEISIVPGCYYRLSNSLKYFTPDSIIHLAEQPSAAWSMKSVFEASITQSTNVIGTLELLWAIKDNCPEVHLIKLGTMGEYGTPDCDIPEGKIPLTCLDTYATDVEWGRPCPMFGLLFPRTPGSFYHASKVMDTINIEFACRNWNLTSTDIMQGVVYGLNEYDKEEEITRFDYDECFGTVINRFCAQGIVGHPLTVYGKGEQTRGYLPLRDSLQCLTIAIENPPAKGEYRTLNQFAQTFSVNQLAEMVNKSLKELGIGTHAETHLPNPRNEAEEHYYKPDHDTLFELGYDPTTDHKAQIIKLFNQLAMYKDNIRESLIEPKIKWS